MRSSGASLLDLSMGKAGTLHSRLPYSGLWGRLPTCGRLLIGLLHRKASLPDVATPWQPSSQSQLPTSGHFRASFCGDGSPTRQRARGSPVPAPGPAAGAPNHVHMLITPRVPVSKVMQSLKRFTARQANLMLGLTGQPFWQDESYDRLIRSGDEFQRVAPDSWRRPRSFPGPAPRPIDNRPQAARGC